LQEKETVLLSRAPSPCSHPLLDRGPDALDDLAVPPAPSAVHATLLIPPLDCEALDAAAPALDLARDVLPAPADVDARGVFEQLRRRGPLVRLELPGLPRREDGHEALPVVRLEVGRGVDEDEARWLLRARLRADGPAGIGLRGVCEDAEGAGDVEDVGRGGGREGRVVRGHEDAVLEERLDVRHADEGGCGGGEEDDGVGAAGG